IGISEVDPLVVHNVMRYRKFLQPLEPALIFSSGRNRETNVQALPCSFPLHRGCVISGCAEGNTPASRNCINQQQVSPCVGLHKPKTHDLGVETMSFRGIAAGISDMID